jgi:hypothetical protein
MRSIEWLRGAAWRASLCAAALSLSSCAGIRAAGLAACPALRPEVSALDASFSANARANAKLRAFVQAAKDIHAAALKLEARAAGACRRMAADLGMPPAQLRERSGAGGAAAGACEPVAAYVAGILRQGIALEIAAEPGGCHASAEAHGRCAGRCDVGQDNECRASCQAHANVHAACRPPRVSVRARAGVERAGALVATLQRNLPEIVSAQIDFGERLYHDARVLGQVGAQLPRMLGDAGAQAIACASAAAELAASATVRIQVSVRASASVTASARGGA